MTTFQAKIGRKNTRKFENKNYGFIQFQPDAYLKIPKKQQKNSKIRKYCYGFISIQNRQEKSEKETKSKLSFRFVPTRRVIENSEKIEKKIQN